MKNLSVDTQNKLIKVIALANLLVVVIEDLEEEKFYRHMLKKKCNTMVKELEKFVDDVWDKGDKQTQKRNTQRIEAVLNCFEDSLKLIL